MKTRALRLAVPVLALAFAGCRDNRASIQLQAICAPPDTCSFTAKCDAQYAGFATIDASRTGHLWLLLQVENQLRSNDVAEKGKLNTNDAHIDEVAIDYEGVSLAKVVAELPNYNVPAAGTAVISVDVIPTVPDARTTLRTLAPTAAYREIVAKIRVRGYLDDGSRFESGEFPVGIRVCSGCLTADSGLCASAATCPPASNGQLPIACL